MENGSIQFSLTWENSLTIRVHTFPGAGCSLLPCSTFSRAIAIPILDNFYRRLIPLVELLTEYCLLGLQCNCRVGGTSVFTGRKL
jgi:hypothetical protein